MHRLRSLPGAVFRAIVACLVVALASVVGVAAEVAPYEARVVATGASVHSGPDEKFYPTDTLAQGDVVEVYRVKSGGWLGIRPPVNSFSWIPGSSVKLREGGLAEITSDDVASRIGSRLSDKHNAAQVRLKKGETVEVLDEETIGEETWYKIAPPAGEFRWIQSALVERTGPIQMVSAESALKSDSAKDSNVVGAAATTPLPEATAPPLMPVAASPPASSSTPPTAVPVPSAAAPLPSAPPMSAAAAAAAPSSTAPVAAAPTTGPVADDLSRELAGIELRLSRMVAAPVNLWNTERLERDAAQLLGRAKTTAERDAVQVTLNKINQFGAISRRATPGSSTAVAQALPTASPVAGVAALAAGATPGTSAATGVAPSGGPYDAVGILRPVVSKRPGAPQYALVDERGQVLSFITPTPDMNLQAYLGRQVGVVGSRGYIAEFKRTHVTAARVTPLSEKIVR